MPPDPSPTRASPLDSDVACIKCNYNLRGLSLDALCPECGLPIADSADRQRLIDRLSPLFPSLRLSLFLIAILPWAMLMLWGVRLLITHAAIPFGMFRWIYTLLFGPLFWLTPAIALCLSRRLRGAAPTYTDVPKLSMSMRILDILVAGALLLAFLSSSFFRSQSILFMVIAIFSWYLTLNPSIIVLRILQYDKPARHLELVQKAAIACAVFLLLTLTVALLTLLSAFPNGSLGSITSSILGILASIEVTAVFITCIASSIVTVNAANTLHTRPLE